MPPKKKPKNKKQTLFNLSNPKEHYTKAEKSTVIQELPAWQPGTIPDWFI